MTVIFEKTSRDKKVEVSVSERIWLDKRLKTEIEMKEHEIDELDKYRIRCDLVDYIINDIDAGCWHCRTLPDECSYENHVFACKELCRIVCYTCKVRSTNDPTILGELKDGILYPYI